MRELHRGLVVALVASGSIILTVGLRGQEAPEAGRGYPAADWPLAGGNWSSARYSTLADITTETVDRLGGAWVARLAGGVSSRATPAVKDGVLYLPGGANVFAIDGRTGDTIWRWQPGTSDAEAGRVPSWQGVGLGEGLVFVGLRSAEVAALRQDTGELVWVEPVGSMPRGEGEWVTTAPMYARGGVFVGLASGDSGGQGRIIGLDAATGEKRWTFFVIPRPGEFGHETWPQDSETWRLGGGGVWLVGAVDPDLGMVYFVTGNPVPMYGGEIRGGDNLFTASVLALDMETGERRWHYQVVRHDIWDADIATPLLLYETEIEGRPRKGVAAIRADGYLFLLDRETGEPLTPIEERPVPQDAYLLTAPTQPFPAGGSILPDCSFWRDRVPPPFELSCSFYTPPSLDRQDVVAPGAPIPMVRVTPMSFSPQTGYIYAQGRAHVGRAFRFDDPWISDNRGSGYLRLTLPESTGILAAVDGRTGDVVWKNEFRGARLATSGPLTTAGGLMFWGSADGRLEAYDARTGELVWGFQAGAPGVRLRPGSAASYAIDGRQFITIAVGGELWALALDGDVPPRPEATEPLDDLVRWIGPPPRATDMVETATLVENPISWSVGGRRNAINEHAFNPLRALVTAGTRVRFVNNGEMAHTVSARDGSWSTGTLGPAMWEHVTFDEPGVFLYHCTDHPWAIGEITVEP